MPSPTTEKHSKTSEPKLASLLDNHSFTSSNKVKDPDTIPGTKEQEKTATESSSGKQDAGHADQGKAHEHANNQQASPPPPPQADNRSFRGRLRARARRFCDKVRRFREDIKEKMTRPYIPHY